MLERGKQRCCSSLHHSYPPNPVRYSTLFFYERSLKLTLVVVGSSRRLCESGEELDDQLTVHAVECLDGGYEIGDGGGQLDRRRARRVLNPCAPK